MDCSVQRLTDGNIAPPAATVTIPKQEARGNDLRVGDEFAQPATIRTAGSCEGGRIVKTRREKKHPQISQCFCEICGPICGSRG